MDTPLPADVERAIETDRQARFEQKKFDEWIYWKQLNGDWRAQ